MASLAAYPAVLIVDDDLTLPGATVTQLIQHWHEEPDVVHGIFGRNPAADGTYKPVTVHGRCEVLLTRAIVVDRVICAAALRFGVQELPGEPRGNGEDIVLSYTAMAASGKRNVAYSLPFINLDYDSQDAISVRFRNHEAHRSDVVRWCRKVILSDLPGRTAGLKV